MENGDKLWQSIEQEQETYNNLGLSEIKNYDKFYLYSIITHSTAIEGSTLTEKDTCLLFDEGFTSKKKPISEYLMNLDLKIAYEYAFEQANEKTKITPSFLQTLNGLVMKSTGSVHNVALGSFDPTKGEYRLCGVRAGFYGKSYMDCQKVPEKVEELCEALNNKLNSAQKLQDIYNLSFDAHFNLVTIHPWIDGNGRTSRLLMNYIQMYHSTMLTKIHKGNRTEYIQSLNDSRENENPDYFRNFMAKQHLKTLREEIKIQKKSYNGGFTLLF
jgi:Uncharacterized conserved protein